MADKTMSRKAAEDQAADTKAVIDSDPTDAGVNDDLATAGAGKDTVLIKADGTVEDSAFDATDSEEFVTLNKDIVEEFFYPNTKRPAYRILHTKGQTVRKSIVDQYNEAAKADRAAFQIDSSTLASGTKAPGAEKVAADADRK